MNFYLTVDRAQMIWAVQKQTEKSFKVLQDAGLLPPGEIKIPAILINTVLETALNSPAYAVHGMDVIYLQGEIPEEYIPMILNHEELHLIVFKEMLNDGVNPMSAGLISNKLIDSRQLNECLAEVFEIRYSELLSFCKSWIRNSLPPIRILKRIGRLLHAISKKRG